jgi:hypothetical protein
MFLLQETIKTRGVHVGSRFAPTAPLDKQHKQQFQIKCSEGFDWRRQEYAEHAWQMTSPQAEGDPRSQLKLTVTTDSVNFEDFFPTSTLDVYFDNLRLAFGVVGTVFNPRIMLSTGAMIRLTAQTEENDGRIFLGQRCLRLDNRLGPLGRPVHAVGRRPAELAGGVEDRIAHRGCATGVHRDRCAVGAALPVGPRDSRPARSHGV